MAIAPLVIALAFLYGYFAAPSFPSEDGGIIASWNGQWILNHELNLWIGISSNILVGILMLIIIRQFNILRNPTKLPSALYGCILLATPTLFINLYPGVLLCLVILCCFLLMFSAFANPNSQRNVFTVFLLLSAFSAIDYGFLIYVPVFILGMAQMRVMNIRSILALLIGLVTPWVILFGFGIVSFSDICWPISWDNNILSQNSGFTAILATAGYTAFLGICAWLQSFIKLISYNTQSRSQLSLLSVTMFVTIIAGCADYSHISVFVPLLTCLSAMLIGHQFGAVYSADGKSYWGLLCIMCSYLGIYCWRFATLWI